MPYLIVLVSLGIPLFALEIAAGQMCKVGSLEVWKSMAPWLAGIGPASVACTFLVNLYYNVIIAWALLYLGFSFSSTLPWTEESETVGNVTTVTMDSHIFLGRAWERARDGRWSHNGNGIGPRTGWGARRRMQG